MSDATHRQRGASSSHGTVIQFLFMAAALALASPVVAKPTSPAALTLRAADSSADLGAGRPPVGHPKGDLRGRPAFWFFEELVLPDSDERAYRAYGPRQSALIRDDAITLFAKPLSPSGKPSPITVRFLDVSPERRFKAGRALGHAYRGRQLDTTPRGTLFQSLEIEGLYPGVDLVLRPGRVGLEYDLRVAPGADVTAIEFEVEGGNEVGLTKRGELAVGSGRARRLLARAPLVYQGRPEAPRLVDGSYRPTSERRFAFTVGKFDGAQDLVIDPELVVGAYVGGSGEDWATGVGVDSQGRLVLAGSTSSTNFPTTDGTSIVGGGLDYDTFVVWLSSDGSSIVHATVLGGLGSEDTTGLTVGPDDAVYVYGSSSSVDYPTGPSSAQAAHGGGDHDGVVARLSSTGTLDWATYLGGDGYDVVHAVGVDSVGRVLVLADGASTTYPGTTGQLGPGGDVDFVLGRYLTDGTLDALVRIGGTEYDGARDLALGATSVFIGGVTDSVDFPGLIGGSALAGALVVELDDTLAQVLLAKRPDDALTTVDSLARGAGGELYVAGGVAAGTVPTTAGVFNAAPGGSGYAARLSAQGNIEWLSNLGSNYGKVHLEVDDFGNLHLAWTGMPWDGDAQSLGLIAMTPPALFAGPTSFYTTGYWAVAQPDGSALRASAHLADDLYLEPWQIMFTVAEGLAVTPEGHTLVVGHINEVLPESVLSAWPLGPDDALGGVPVLPTGTGYVFRLAHNAEPVITSSPTLSGEAGVAWSYSIVATDPDGDPLSYALVSGPSGFAVDNASGLATWTPGAGGSYPVTVQASDGQGGKAEQAFTITVTQPNSAPEITSSAVLNATVDAVYSYDVEASDADLDPLDFSLLTAPAGMVIDALSGLITWTPTTQGDFPVDVQVEDPHGASDTQSFTISVAPAANVAPVLAPIGNRSVAPGATLVVQLSASDVNGDPLIFSAAPLPLPAGAMLGSGSGVFTFAPEDSQSGTFDITFSVSDGELADSETVQITVETPDPLDPTSLSGRVLDTNDFALGVETPVVGVSVSILNSGVSALTDANGAFALSGVPAGAQTLDFDTSGANLAPDGSAYAGFREAFELMANVENVIDRPVYLPRIDTSGAAMVDPATTTVVANTAIGVTVTVPPNTAKNEDGTDFTGQLSVSSLPPELAPAALPEAIEPGMLFTVQPVGVTFENPVPITFPNFDGLPPGTITDLWSLDPVTGQFAVVGKGQVSADGAVVETIVGGIRAADWHVTMPAPLGVPGNAPNGLSSNNNSGRLSSLSSMACTGSSTAVAAGSLTIEHVLAPYWSLDAERSLRLVYDSLRADPRPTIAVDVVVPGGSALSDTISARLNVGGIDQEIELFTDTSGLGSGATATLRQELQFDATELATGLYPYRVNLSNNFNISSRVQGTNDVALVRNDSDSAFGAGWTLAGLQRLLSTPNGALITDGDGSTLVFERRPEFGQVLEASFGGIAGPALIATGDLDGDGGAEVIAASSAGGTYRRYKVDSAGNLVLVSSFFPSVGGDEAAIVLADFNRDGALDLVVAANDTGLSVEPDQVGIALNNGDGTFAAPVIVEPSGRNLGRQSLAVADFDFDGRLDVMVTGAQVELLRGDGNGGFSSVENVGLATDPLGVVTADLNADSLPDVLVLQNNLVTAFLGDGLGGFTASASESFDGFGPVRLAVLDLEGDGTLDVVVRSRTGVGTTTRLTLLRGDGSGALAAGGVFELDGAGNEFAAVDVNGDGLDDLALAIGGRLEVLLSDGLGNFVPAADTLLNQAHSLAVADLDGDGVPDLGALAGGTANNHKVYAVLLSSGEGYISPPGDYSTLVGNTDGTFTRRLKDGMTHEFDAAGLHVQTRDRNGNAMVYGYTGGQLTSITDPVGQVTQFVYQGERVEQIIDPASRITRFEYDAQGDLRRIVDPDQTDRRFEYVAHRLVKQFSKRNFETQYQYDFAGRFEGSTWPDTSTRGFAASETVAVIDPQGPVGTELNPAPVVLSTDAISTLTDGTGDAATYRLDRYGASTSHTDGAGLTAITERDEDGNPTRIVPPDGGEASFAYDELGNALSATDAVLSATRQLAYDPTFSQLTSVTDAFQKTTSFDVDPVNGNLRGVLTPEGRQSSVEYNARGQVERVVDPFGTVTLTEYNASGNVERITHGLGLPDARVTAFTYTAEGYVDTLTDAESRVVDLDYDAMGRVTRRVFPDLQEVTFGYDASGNVSSVSPPGRPAHTFEHTPVELEARYSPPDIGLPTHDTVQVYTPDQQLTSRTLPDGRVITIDYDSGNRPDLMTLPRGPVDFVYRQDTGQLEQVVAPDGGVVSHAYQGDLHTGTTWTGSVAGTVTQTYDVERRVKTQSVNGGQTVTFDYDDDGLLTDAGALALTRHAQHGMVETTTLGQVTSSQSYNAYAELESHSASVDGTVVYQVSYQRDRLGRVTTETETVEGTTSVYEYTYHPRGWLETVTTDGVQSADYRYDANGNRDDGFDFDGPITGTYDAQDRLLSYNQFTYAYRADGSLQTRTDTSTTEVQTYDYDALGNLLSVTLADTTLIEYVVDGLNRRTGKRVDGSLVQGWLYQDGLNPVAELDGSGNVVARFVYSEKSTVPAYMEKGTSTYRIISDELGSVRLVIDTSTGAVVQRIDYDAWGRVMLDTNPGFQPFGYAGGLYDTDTNLVRFGARDYDAQVGRWTAKDPIGLAGGLNTHAYVENDPVNLADPIGLVPPDNIPFGVDLAQNIQEARNMSFVQWYNAVRNGGKWDYKQLGRKYEDFGNYNFGVTARAVGIPGNIPNRGAGWAQIRAGTSKPAWGNPWDWPPSNFGDDPNDQIWINKGMEDYETDFFDPNMCQ